MMQTVEVGFFLVVEVVMKNEGRAMTFISLFFECFYSVNPMPHSGGSSR